jgi:hypothetical protein
MESFSRILLIELARPHLISSRFAFFLAFNVCDCVWDSGHEWLIVRGASPQNGPAIRNHVVLWREAEVNLNHSSLTVLGVYLA